MRTGKGRGRAAIRSRSVTLQLQPANPKRQGLRVGYDRRPRAGMFAGPGTFTRLSAPRYPANVSARLTSATALIVSEIIAASNGFGWDDIMTMTIRFRRSTNRYWP